jgi:hypothetical protein
MRKAATLQQLVEEKDRVINEITHESTLSLSNN